LEFNASGLQAETAYKVSVRDITDNEGIRLASLTWSFFTRDCPRVIEFAPQGDDQPLNPQITVTFDRDMNHSSVESQLTIGPAYYMVYKIAWSVNTMTITFQRLLFFGMVHTVKINGTDTWYYAAEDSEGVKMKTTFTGTFKTRPAKIKLESFSIYHMAGDDKTCVYGELKNEEDMGISNVRFNLTYMYHGTMVRTVEVNYFSVSGDRCNHGLDYIEPMGVTPFKAPLSDPVSVDDLRIEFVHVQPAIDDPFYGFGFRSLEGTFDSIQQIYYLNGTIYNEGGQPLNPAIIATFYDSAGTVIGTAWTSPYDEMIDGDTAPFRVKIYLKECDLPMIRSYRIRVADLV